MASKDKKIGEILSSLAIVEKQLQDLLSESDRVINPVRQAFLQRFPILFILLVTFGLTATFYAFERILSEIAFLSDRPWLILGVGVGTLVVTGTLYKKLG